MAAARLWLAYAAGKPGASADPDTLDAHDLEVRRRSVATAEDIKTVFERGAVAPPVREFALRTLEEGLGRPAAPPTAADERGKRPATSAPGLVRKNGAGLPGGKDVAARPPDGTHRP
ncbi:MAG: hypothetical protein ACRC33_02120 [Gemmataceae bacterium]